MQRVIRLGSRGEGSIVRMALVSEGFTWRAPDAGKQGLGSRNKLGSSLLFSQQE